MPITPLTPPPTWVNGEVTLAQLNARIRDAVAELQTAVTPGPWVALTLASGFTNSGGSDLAPLAVRSYNGGLQFRGEFATPTLTGTAVQAGALPSGFTTDVRYNAAIAGQSGAPVPVRFDLRINGQIWLSGSGVRASLDGVVVPT